MIFVAIIEMMLLFYYPYLETKGKYYYDKNECYWCEDNNPLDALSYKMYMDLYADYSLADKRYCENIQTNEGLRFVLTGEVIHGLFCIIFSPILMYLYFTKMDKIYIYLAAILFSAAQFLSIVWYLTSVFLEMKFVTNDKFWWCPLLWNVPWIVIPLYIMYYAGIEIIQKSQSQSLNPIIPLI